MQKFFTFKSEKAAIEYYWKHIGVHKSEIACRLWVDNHVDIGYKVKVVSEDKAPRYIKVKVDRRRS